MSQQKPNLHNVWSRNPGAAARKMPYEIWRPEKSGKTEMTILSKHAHGTSLHWYQGRSRICDGEGGVIHTCGSDCRAYCFLLVQFVEDHALRIAQLPGPAWGVLFEHAQKVGSLHGTRIRVGRTKRKSNGPVLVEIARENYSHLPLPKAVDILPMLERMYGLVDTYSAESAATRGPDVVDFREVG